jgi:hypothetical protein
MQSGAALKELYDRGDQIANQDFTAERNFDYGRYTDEAARSDANFATDRNFGYGVYADETGRSDSNFNTDRNYGQNIFTADRSYNDSVFNTDRDYATGVFDAKTNNLFRLTGIGVNAAGSITGSNNALLGQQVDSTETATQARIRNNQNQNNIWKTTAGSIGSSIGRAVNPLASF